MVTETSDVDFDNLPPIDEKSLLEGSVFVDDYKEPEILSDDSNAEPDKPVDASKDKPVDVSTDTVDDYWKTLKETFGEEYKIPEVLVKGVNDKGEPLSPKEKLDLLKSEILSTTLLGKDEEDDRFVRSYLQESAKEGFNKKEFFERITSEQNLDSMEPKDFLFVHYKNKLGLTENNPKGLTDEQIKDDIERLSAIELHDRYNTIKGQRDKEQKTLIEKYQADQNEKWLSNYNKFEEENKLHVKTYVEKISTMRNVDGFELGEADKKEFIKSLPDLVKRNIKEIDGRKIATSEAEDILYEITSTPEKSMMLLPLLWMWKNGKLNNYTSNIREQAKRDVDAKLSNTKLNFGSNADFEGTGEIDVDRLYNS